MGRSQVLYNRTKGRYKNRGGGGRGGRGGGDEIGRASQGKRRNLSSGTATHELDEANQSHEEVDDFPGDQEVVDEAMVLLADASMSAQRSYIYDRTQREKEDEVAAAFNILEAGGSINVPSMAATFNTLSMSQRLRMPQHVIALALQRNELPGDTTGDHVELQDKRAFKKSGFCRKEDDDISYTIAGTRNRATILSDGQVEVRPQPNRFSEESGTSSVIDTSKSNLSNSQSVASRAHTTNDESAIDAIKSATSKDSRKQSKHVIMQVISDDDPEEDKYFVLEASTTTSSHQDDEVGGESVTNDNDGGNINMESGEALALEDWLDETVVQSGDGKEDSNLTKTVTADPFSKGGRSFAKKSKVPGRSCGPSLMSSNIEKEGRAKSTDEKINSTSSPLLRQRQQKQRLRHQRGRQSEPETSSGSGATEDYDYDGEEEEEKILHQKSSRSYDVYSVDSGGKMFEDSESDADVGLRHQSAVRASSTENKNAMRDYVIHTTHKRTPKSPNHSVVAKTDREEEGEDLDEWLDSVIE
ncbi:hypothetical protein IV203_037269 [Nitzschia inconspicua]|uniref:Uncharacterized protein n=1 Tax=Nitzschia inconspicua TaxID=303405 RepID=A0A9K3LL53_9STRA|nr:hypothetical protein IV203_037269 [Nitzschia inconspicua]